MFFRHFKLGAREGASTRRRRALQLLPIGVAAVSATAQEAPAFSDAAASAATAAPAAATATPTPTPTEPQRVLIRGHRLVDVGPMPGLAITREQIPANLQSATKEEIKVSRALSLADYMNTRMQGVSVNDYAGNPFQLDLNYRGFTASPQTGTPQGLSVFFDSVRVNEPFGDVVNWDLIPLNAIERFDLFPASSPIFGLNTLGGAISVRTKSGFTAPGFDASVTAGMWGRRQLQLSGGWHGDEWAAFGAGTYFDESGWRDGSPSRVAQLYGRADRRFDRGIVTASLLAADNRLVGNGLIPIELFDERPESVFTSPDRSDNKLVQATLAGTFDVSDTWNVVLRAYQRKSDRQGLSGDIYEGFQDMYPQHDSAPDPDDPFNAFPRNGAHEMDPVLGNYVGPGYANGTPIGLLTTTTLRQRTRGLTLQSNWNLPAHKLMVGASVDRSRSSYLMTQRLGLIDAAHRVHLATITTDQIVGPGEINDYYYAAGHDVPGNDFNGVETTSSLYFSETWSARPDLHLTLTGRYNHTRTRSDLLVRSSEGVYELHELHTGTNGLPDRLLPTTRTEEAFTFNSFNPSVGVNWLPGPDLNLYGNLGRGARTPSVVELGCAFDPTPQPFKAGDIDFGSIPASLNGPGCNLPTSLSGDPFLPQIRSTSGEIGARGRIGARWEWNASLYRTDLKDDIYFVGVGDNRSYFDTVGKTRRQGIELGLEGGMGPFELQLGYSYVKATFESTFYTASPHNSSADFDQNSQPVYTDITTRLLPTPGASANRGRGTFLNTRIDSGARLPGIPLHSFNGTLRWQATAGLRLGLGMVARSSSFVRGNENNLHQPEGTDQQTGLYYCGFRCVGSYQQLDTGPGRTFRTEGKVPGYAIFNLDASWQMTKQLSLALQVTNLFDRRYFTAGRLGINPYSPSVHGVIGPSGWNYNSYDWQNTTFVGPGAPRGFFVSLNHAFDAK